MFSLPFFQLTKSFLMTLAVILVHESSDFNRKKPGPQPPPVNPVTGMVTCNCEISQAGNTYPISALMGNESSVSFYSYGVPNSTSANTGLELSNGLILFLYEDINTGLVSLFLIADIANDGSGGTMSFEVNCLPPAAYVAVQDDAGEFVGSPPLITGNWTWLPCCTDGGVIEDIGCNNTINLDLLVSTGIDSIVWLTGDIASPTPILLSMTGEAITIDCGGSGVCCPIGLDTESEVTDATCPNTTDGMITLNPQDGFPPYMYDWSNGATSATNSGLGPGNYQVTVTDAQGCTEELAFTIDNMNNEPPAQTATLDLCSENTMDFFDLTTVNDIVNLGSGFDVLWFENPDLTGNIPDPSNYFSGPGIVYAVVDNGPCLSEPVAVTLQLLLSPSAEPASVNACEEENEMATFDLTALDNAVSGGVGVVLWFLDPGMNNPISDPTSFYTSSITIYAVVDDGVCFSVPVEVELIVDLQPEGEEAEMYLCGDENNEAVFDLTQLDLMINGGFGSVEWFIESDLLDPITSPTAYLTTTTVVYAAVFDGVCYSDAIPVQLVVELTPVGNPITISQCDNGAGEAVFNLNDYEAQVSGGAGGVTWYWDPMFIDPILNPGAFQTESTIVYASIDNGTCISGPVNVTLVVSEAPQGNSGFLETCADSSGQGVFNLTLLDTVVSGGTGIVFWYEDAQGSVSIANPVSYSSSGSSVYAQIDAGGCLSGLIPIALILINTVTAIPVDYSHCEDVSGMAVFDLPSIASQVSNNTGVVTWYLDSSGTLQIPFPDMFLSGDSIVYAIVTAGTCVSDIVPITLLVLPVPQAMGLVLNVCGDSLGQVSFDLTSLDTLIGDPAGSVLWFADSLLTIPVPGPVVFLQTDTSFFAVVSNGLCLSPSAEVQISVSSSLEAIPLDLEWCIPAGDTLILDLGSYEIALGAGSNTVYWFEDSLGTTAIIRPDSFPVSSSRIIYAAITDGICRSDLVPVSFTLLDIPVAHAISIQRCGDTIGQIMIDLTSVDTFISGNTGIVTWFADSALTLPIITPASFQSGDTILYATVTNINCISTPVPVPLNIVDSLIALSQDIRICVVDMPMPTIDLRPYEFEISGGNGTVTWFTDMNATDTLHFPETFTTDGDTLYATVEADGCESGVAVITIEIENALVPISQCDFTSQDSVSISWTPVSDAYEVEYQINGIPAGSPQLTSFNTFSLGGLGQGDTILLMVSALYNDICTTPLTATLTCITDLCPLQSIVFPGLLATYCRDEAFILLQANLPGGLFSGQGIAGDTLYPSQVSATSSIINFSWEDGVTECVYDTAVVVSFVEPPSAPLLNCQTSTLHSITFSWSDTNPQYGYAYRINYGTISNAITTSDAELAFSGLNEGDSITLSLWSIGTYPCENSDTVFLTCGTEICPVANILVLDPGRLCTEDGPVQLEAMTSGLSGSAVLMWSGQGIVNPSGVFDPGVASPGVNTVEVHVQDGECTYDSFGEIIVMPSPQASFSIDGVPCLDSTLLISFTGEASDTALFQWALSAANVVPVVWPVSFSVSWDSPGTYSLSLEIDDGGCLSDVSVTPVSIDAPLDAPLIQCEEEDYYSVVVSWEPVNGATRYEVISSAGTGRLNGNTYTISNLHDDEIVTVTVTALGPTVCGPVSSSIECQTLDYIPPSVFIADIFSPNDDGINDILYVQTNDRVTEINTFRLFDRWGNLVFENLNFYPNDPAAGWDGTFAGKFVNPAVYVYWLEYTTIDGDVLTKAGDVTLVK